MDGASRTMTRLSLELGGNAPVLVLPDVDIASWRARRRRGQVPQRRPGLRLAAAILRRSGQPCRVRGASSLEETRKLQVGSGLDPDDAASAR